MLINLTTINPLEQIVSHAVLLLLLLAALHVLLLPVLAWPGEWCT